MVKVQIIQKEDEMHSLSQDFARVLLRNDDNDDYTDCIVECANGKNSEHQIKAHSLIIRTRCPELEKMLQENKDIENNVSVFFII